jgi:2-oxoglutarate/2-oxoacid ferredoxin oxidoreductase subunit beta
MTHTYMTPDAESPYCRGCGHGLVLRALGDALSRNQLLPHELVIVSDIGCFGLADASFSTPHTVHTTHGRSTAFAAGMALVDEVLGCGRLKPIVLIGDGGAMIGLGHLVHAALSNAGVTVLVHNNFMFGMTGGQNSAYTPLEFVTATTPAGNTVPPLDLGRLLLASRASFVARKLATDRDLAEVIARAVAHPGFAVVEILELCTTYATRWNPLNAARLRAIAEASGYQLGILRDEPRPRFSDAYKAIAATSATTARRRRDNHIEFRAPLERPLGLVLAGTAGERVQTAASLLASAAMRSGLQATQKNDNPVTQGSGFSVSELILSPEEIVFTGIDRPDALLTVSEDGRCELDRGGFFARLNEASLVLADADLSLPDLPCKVLRLPFRRSAGPKLAATAAAAAWTYTTGALPLEAFWRALDARLGAEAAPTKAKLSALLESVSGLTASEEKVGP